MATPYRFKSGYQHQAGRYSPRFGLNTIEYADVMELADVLDSKSSGSDTVRVQVPQPALLGRGKVLRITWYMLFLRLFLFLQRKIES